MRNAMLAVLLLTLFPATGLAQGSGSPSSDCDPPCRSGYTCKDGDCVEKCNPPCPEGTQCTDSGECMPVSTGAQPPVRLGRTGAPDPGWARGASICGFGVGGGVLLGAIITAAFFEEPDISIPLGIVTTLFGGVAIPIIAAGAASARKSGLVDGLFVLRIVGWIAYGGAMINAVIAIGLSFAEIPVFPPITIAIGLLGGAGAAAHAVDGLASANEAETRAAVTRADSGRRIKPILAAAPARGGGVTVFAGVGGTF